MVPDASIAFAAVTLMASKAGGRPPTRPRARLAAIPILVRSRKSSTSNCPRAAKMWRISRPVALVVSMFSCNDRSPMPRAADGPRWLEAGAWFAPVDRAGERPAHHPRGRIPRRRQAVGDRSAPLGATDALVARDSHDRPAEPSSGFLEGLSTDQQLRRARSSVRVSQVAVTPLLDKIRIGGIIPDQFLLGASRQRGAVQRGCPPQRGLPESERRSCWCSAPSRIAWPTSCAHDQA